MTISKIPALSTKFYQILMALLLLVGVILRFYDLDSRPVHHDESLHGTYARYAVENPEQSFYHYNPMLHGPLLYNCTAWLFSIFGVSTFSLRLLNAILGSLFVLTPLLFRRFISPSAVVWATAALALSPGLVYWSRFAHHDYLVLASYTLLAAGVFLCSARTGIIFCLLSFAIQYTIKANIFVFAALLLGYLVFEFICTKYFKTGDKNPSLVNSVFKSISLNKGATVLGSLVAAVIFSALYSGNFRESAGILDGLYRKVFEYWWEQHKIQRLDGPFSFHLLVLFLYELPILLAFVAALYLSFLRLPSLQKKAIAALSVIFAAAPFFLPSELYNKGFLEVHMKVKSPFDLFVNLEVALLAVVLPVNFIRSGQRAISFFCYLSLATLWSYSFLGEKVPWLSIYPQVTALIFTVLLFDKWGIFSKGFLSLNSGYSLSKSFSFLSTAVLGIATVCAVEGLAFSDPGAISNDTLRLISWSFGLLLTFAALQHLQIDAKVPAFAFALFVLLSFYTSIITNFTRAGDKRELLSQVHTNEESHKLFTALRDYLTDPLKKGDKKVLISGSSVWPATWYMRNVNGYYFTADKSEYSTFNYLVVDETDDGVDGDFDTETVPLQSWWVPDYSKLRVKSLLTYYFTHEPWNPPGSLQVKFAVPMEVAADEAQSDSDEAENDAGISSDEEAEENAEDVEELDESEQNMSTMEAPE